LRLQVKGRKVIKKILKTGLIILLVITGLVLAGYVAIHIPGVQTEGVKKAVTYLEKELGNRIGFTAVRVRLFNRVMMSDFYLTDLQGDTLVRADIFSAHLRRFRPRDRELFMSRIILENPDIRFRVDTAGEFNLTFLVKALKRKDFSKPKMRLRFDEIILREGRFTFRDERVKPGEKGVQFADLEMNDLDLSLDGLRVVRDSISFNIRHLSFLEKSGLLVRNWSSENMIHKQFAEIRSLRLQTGRSSVRLPSLRLDYPSYSSLKFFSDSVRMQIGIETSNIALSDIALFAPALEDINETVLLEGKINGRLSNLNGRDLKMFYGGNTYYQGNFDLIGLPRINETFIFFEVEELVTTAGDIETLKFPRNNRRIRLPDNLRKLGRITYRGNFTGFTDDFVAYGRLDTDLGELSLDLSFKPDSAHYFSYEGSVRTSGFRLGKFISAEPAVGNIALSVNLAGISRSGREFRAELDGVVDSLLLKGYRYTNIDLEGKMTEKMFDGSVEVEDPNVKLSFLGLLDFSGETPEFDFTLNVPRANLHNLNIDRQDTSSTLSMLLTANFRGSNLDNLDGDIKLFNSSLQRHGREWNIYDFSLMAMNRPDTSMIMLRTDFMNAEILGKYEVACLPDAFEFLLQQYLPAMGRRKINPDSLAMNDFTYHITFRNMDPMLQVLLPEYSISEGATLSGRFAPADTDFSFTGNIDKLGFGKNYFSNLRVNTTSDDSRYIARLQAEHLYLSRNFDLVDLRFSSCLQNDSLSIDIRWDDQARIRNMGEMHTLAHFIPSPTGKYPAMDILIMPSKFMVQDTLWTLSPTQIRIDSSYTQVDGFRLQNHNQVLAMQGAVSSDPADTMHVDFQNLNLELINLFLNNEKTVLEGIIHGQASLSSLYRQPMFSSQLVIHDLAINREVIGNTTMTSVWEPESKAIKTTAYAMRNDDRTILLDGQYFPESSALDFEIGIEKLRLQLLRPFLSKVFRDVNGMASGNLTLKGTTREPLLNGRINMQKAIIDLQFLNTRYSFTHPLVIRDNSLFFEEVQVYDDRGHTATLNGKIVNESFRDLMLDMTLDVRNFHFLNTDYSNNSDFYGTAFGTGVVRISGPPNDLEIRITARTEENTTIYIPLTSGSEIQEVNYIRFINTLPDAASEIDKKEYEVDLSGIRMNFNLEITPAAETQLIFDSRMGDIIRGRGYGNINMEINTFGRFRMFGEYEFTEGDYLFTLQNIINKRLEIREGSKIIWNGDPLDAHIDLEAVYSLRTSLYELFMEENFRRRIPVECQLFLTNRLMNPNIRFDIYLPTTDEETRNYLKNAINTEEKLSKQFLSLLVLNSFLPDPNINPMASTNPLGNYTLGAESVGVTTSELLSNQLSRWLSQISNDLDIGFTYRPGDEINRDQVELALSTQLLDDRVAINGNVDVGGYQSQTSTSNIVGDFNVEVKLNESGKLRVKAFNRANDKLIYEQAPYTQGIGLFYREEFDSFGQLMGRYWDKLFGKKEEDE